jgi:hypothetical protein
VRAKELSGGEAAVCLKWWQFSGTLPFACCGNSGPAPACLFGCLLYKWVADSRITSRKELKACGTHKLSLAVSVTARQKKNQVGLAWEPPVETYFHWRLS